MSACTSASRPDRRAPIGRTMSSSVAPSASACCASNTFVRVRWFPCGKPMVVPTATSVPARIAAARLTSAGRRHTDATSYFAASRQPASTAASSSSGRRSEWSIVFAMSRSVRLSIESVMGLLVGTLSAVRPQHVPRDEEALLDLVVGPLEPPVLVLDDAVPLEPLAVERGEDDAPVHLAQTGDARDLPAHAH